MDLPTRSDSEGYWFPAEMFEAMSQSYFGHGKREAWDVVPTTPKGMVFCPDKMGARLLNHYYGDADSYPEEFGEAAADKMVVDEGGDQTPPTDAATIFKEGEWRESDRLKCGRLVGTGMKAQGVAARSKRNGVGNDQTDQGSESSGEDSPAPR